MSIGGAGYGGGGGGSSGVRMGGAFVELYTKSRVGAGLTQFENDIRSGIGRVQGVVQGLSAKAFAGGVAGLSALGYATTDTLGEMAKIADATKAFGLTAEAGTRLFGVMAAAGSDTRDAVEGLITMNARVADALSGTGEVAVELFDDLGVSAQKFAGLNTAERFALLTESLRNVADPAKRADLLLKAVGEDTGKNLLPVLAMSAAEVDELGKAFERSAADLKAAKDATRAMAGASNALSAAWKSVAVSVAPVMTDAANAIKEYVGPARQWIESNREMVAMGVKVAAGLTAVAGAAMVAAPVIGGALVGGVTVLSGVLSGVGAVASAAAAGIVGVVTVGTTLIGVAGAAVTAVGALGGALLAPIATLTAALPVIGTAALGAAAAVAGTAAAFTVGAVAVGALAAGVVYAGSEFLKLTAAGQQLRTGIVSSFGGVARASRDIGAKALTGDLTGAAVTAAANIQGAFSGVAASIQAGWISTVGFMSDAWRGVAAAVRAGDVELAVGVVTAAIEVAWTQGVVQLTAGWNGFKSVVVDGWHVLARDARLAVVDIEEGFLTGVARIAEGDPFAGFGANVAMGAAKGFAEVRSAFSDLVADMVTAWADAQVSMAGMMGKALVNDIKGIGQLAGAAVRGVRDSVVVTPGAKAEAAAAKARAEAARVAELPKGESEIVKGIKARAAQDRDRIMGDFDAGAAARAWGRQVDMGEAAGRAAGALDRFGAAVGAAEQAGKEAEAQANAKALAVKAGDALAAGIAWYKGLPKGEPPPTDKVSRIVGAFDSRNFGALVPGGGADIGAKQLAAVVEGNKLAAQMKELLAKIEKKGAPTFTR